MQNITSLTDFQNYLTDRISELDATHKRYKDLENQQPDGDYKTALNTYAAAAWDIRSEVLKMQTLIPVITPEISAVQQLTTIPGGYFQIEFNPHLDHSTTGDAKLYIEKELSGPFPIEKIEEDVLQKMIETNTIVSINLMANDADGSPTLYSIYHYDVELAAKEIIKFLEASNDTAI